MAPQVPALDRIRRAILPILPLLALACAAAAASAQTETVPRAAIAAGGGISSDGVVQIVSTVGQPVIGAAAAPDQTASFGFWATARTAIPPVPPGSGEDTDGDGLPDECETRFGLDPLNPGDALADPDGDGVSNLAECQAGTHPRGFFRAYLAEGAKNAFFSTRIALLNPDAAPARVLTTFQPADTASLPPTFTVVGPRTRATFETSAMTGAPVGSFSTLIESDRRLVVDRTMLWDAERMGSHAETAAVEPAAQWYLAEGATHGPFDLFYLLQNPNDAEAAVDVRFLRGPFDPPIELHYVVPPRGRTTIWVDRADPGLAAADVSASILSSLPIVVERSMYVSTPGVPFAGGATAMGATSLAPRWFLAEGATGSFFSMYVLIGNPTPDAAVVQVTYLLPWGGTIVKTHGVAANSRYTIDVAQEDPALTDTAVSAIVESTNAVPLVVDRAMWWPARSRWYEGHLATASPAAGTRWALAEGEDGGADNTHTYVLIANTSAFAGSARVTLLFEDGSSVEKAVALAANSRSNIDTRADFPDAAGRRFGVLVESLVTDSQGPAQLVVERAMYSDAQGVLWSAGTVALATKLP